MFNKKVQEANVIEFKCYYIIEIFSKHKCLK